MIHKILTWPVDLVIKVGEQVQEEVDKELYDLEHIQKKLIHLQMMYELEEIGEEAYKEREEELLIRYEVAKKRQIKEAEELTKREEK